MCLFLPESTSSTEEEDFCERQEALTDCLAASHHVVSPWRRLGYRLEAMSGKEGKTEEFEVLGLATH